MATALKNITINVLEHIVNQLLNSPGGPITGVYRVKSRQNAVFFPYVGEENKC